MELRKLGNPTGYNSLLIRDYPVEKHTEGRKLENWKQVLLKSFH